MDNQDIEKQLQERIDKVETREFSAVWEEIKGEIEAAPSQRKKTPRWIPAVASVACAVAVCSVAIPLALRYGNDAPITQSSSQKEYFHDKLFLENVSLELFAEKLQASEINFLDYSAYTAVSSALYVTTEDTVKGGKIELFDDMSYLSLEFYAEDVTVSRVEDIVYDLEYSVGTTVIEYRLKEANSANEFYKYDIKAEHQSTQYYIEYTSVSEDITPFLNSFFQ